MTKNPLLTWSIILPIVYFATGPYIPGTYVAAIASLLLMIFAGFAFIRYFGEAWEVVVHGKRNPYAQDGAHLAAYGVALLAFGAVYTGCFNLLWIGFGQPESWVLTHYSSFGRNVMWCGFALLWVSPGVSREGLKMPKPAWLFVIAGMAIILAFILGLKVGQSDRIAMIEAAFPCPVDMPVKGNRRHRENIYHASNGAFYTRTKPEACFVSVEAARAAGYRPPSSDAERRLVQVKN